jgi:hypothetical protein
LTRSRPQQAPDRTGGGRLDVQETWPPGADPPQAGRGGLSDPTDPTPPNDAPDPPPHGGPSGHSWGNRVGVPTAVPSIRLVTPPEWRRVQSNGHTSRDKQLKTQAFALLHENPGMSRNALRAALRVHRETAARLNVQWEHVRTRPQAHVAAR